MGSNLVVTVALIRRGGELALGSFAAIAAVFTIYLAVQRATLSEPSAAARRVGGPDPAVGASSVLVLAASVPTGVVLLAVGLSGVHALLPLAVFLPLLALEDNARYMSSRVGRPQIAVAMDGLWLGAVLLAILLLPHASGSVLVWLWAGSGAVGLLAGLGLSASVARPLVSVSAAFAWWRRECATVSRATGLDMFLSQIYAQGTVFLIIAAFGLTGAGQYRAAQSLFGGCMATIVALNMYALPRLRSRGSSPGTVASLGSRYLAAVSVVGLVTLVFARPAQELVFGRVVVSESLALATFVLFCLLSLSSAQATALRVHASSRQSLLLVSRLLMLLVGVMAMLLVSGSRSLALVTWAQGSGVAAFVVVAFVGLRPGTGPRASRRRVSSFAIHSAAVDLPLAGALYCALRGLGGLRPTSATGLVIEGFPRSANTYAKAAFLDANPSVRVASHLHSARSVRQAVRRGIPTVVLVRDPVDAIASLLVRDKRVHPRSALKAYIRFHDEIYDLRERVTVADFDEVTHEFGAVIERVNARYGTAFAVYRSDISAEARVRSEIDRMETEFAGGVLDERAVARPSRVRHAAGEQARVLIAGTQWASLVDQCYRSRDRLVASVRAVQSQ